MRRSTYAAPPTRNFCRHICSNPSVLRRFFVIPNSRNPIFAIVKNIHRVIYFCIVFMCASGIRCGAMMQREPLFDEAALLMYESPDSAMLIVEKAEPRLSAERIGAREDADSVANTVFNYYKKHGTHRERFDMYYILVKMQFPCSRRPTTTG